ncbi:hypothetical protein COCOBI_01-2810 [Coccomyxa sp. Obi]|nr:hypothetical protein COCOBI_01-2810 [Coccomyxa sp. Obi]
MGRPIVQVCSQKGCSAVSFNAPNEGVFFDLREAIFAKKMNDSNTQLWACCAEHKQAALDFVLKDMPLMGKSEEVEA